MALLLVLVLFVPMLFWSWGKYRQSRERMALETRAGELADQALELAQKGDYDNSIARLRQALALTPGDTDIVHNLVIAYGNWILLTYQQGNHQKVMELGARARRQGIHSPRIFYYNAQSFYRDGQTDSAYFLLRAAHDSLPYDDLVASWLSQLESERALETGFENDRSGYFNVRFEGAENREVSALVLSMLENIREQVGNELGYRMQRNTGVILYSDRQFQDITQLASWAGAAFDGQIKVPVASYRNNQDLLKKVLVHEFTHAAIYDMAGGKTPAWLNEGLAMLFEGAEHVPAKYIPLSRLRKPFTQMNREQVSDAYGASLSAVKYLTSQYDMAFLRMLFANLQKGKDFEPAFHEAYGQTPAEFDQRWKENLDAN
jgi:tetratricopeptide (TPR) repeat protein